MSDGDPGLSTRDRLIAAAFATVAHDGLGGASVKAIAARAGVAPGLLHYHFPTLDALLEAVLRRALADYLAASVARRAATQADRQLDAFFASARASAAADRDFFRVRLAFAARALADPVLAAVLRDLNATAYDETARTFAASRGAVEPSANDRAIAATLKAAFDGLMLAWLNDDAFPVMAAGATIEAAVRAALK